MQRVDTMRIRTWGRNNIRLKTHTYNINLNAVIALYSENNGLKEEIKF